MKRSLFFLTLFLLAAPAAATAATYYIAPASAGGNNSNAGNRSSPWATFAYAFGRMSAGDTLILKDGTYEQSLRDPPSGTEGGYTTIRSENDGGAIVDASNLGDDATALDLRARRYVRIEGLKFKGGNADGTGKSAGVVLYVDHVKILRCAFYDPSLRSAVEDSNGTNYHAVSIGDSSYVLCEDCWVWGHGRYKFESHESDHVICRRCVARYDQMRAHFPKAVFAFYGSPDNQCQNCLAIDSDQSRWYEGLAPDSEGFYGGIVAPNGAFWHEGRFWSNSNLKILGGIALKVSGAGIGSSMTYGPNWIRDSVVWDADAGISYSIPSEADAAWRAATSLLIDHVTVGEIHGRHDAGDDPDGVGFMSWSDGTHATIRNSLLLESNAYGICYPDNSDYNTFFDNGLDYGDPWCPRELDSGRGLATHDRHEDPGLRYLVRAEETPLEEARGSDGRSRGATILKRYGRSGTLWGDPGYEELTDEDLWPWPYEERIRDDMRNFPNPPGYVGATPYSHRGFCADGMTLTRYIWEYLGNPMPSFGTPPPVIPPPDPPPPDPPPADPPPSEPLSSEPPPSDPAPGDPSSPEPPPSEPSPADPSEPPSSDEVPAVPDDADSQPDPVDDPDLGDDNSDTDTPSGCSLLQ